MVCCRLFFLHITVKWSYSCNFVSTFRHAFAQTTLYHCTIASHHCTYCVSLHSILGPVGGIDAPGVKNEDAQSRNKLGEADFKGQPANPGSPGRMAVKRSVRVCLCVVLALCTGCAACSVAATICPRPLQVVTNSHPELSGWS